jgi:predicted  nucleic acid-binding Zn-ribbon protein
MNSVLAQLLDLQEVDLRFQKLVVRGKILPKELDNLKKELAAEKTSVEDIKTELNQAELAMKKCESEMASEKEKVDKLNTQSSMVKKNDEYQAILSEIDGHKEKIDNLETKEIEFFDIIDDLTKKYEDASKELIAIEKSLKKEMQELIDLAGDLKKEIEVNRKKSTQLEAKVTDKELLSLYKRLLKKEGSTPVTQVQHDSCGNCHLKILPETKVDIQKKGYALCDNCGYIIYGE